MPILAASSAIVDAVRRRPGPRSDDRIDVRSVGDFPTGIRAEMRTREPPSRPRKRLIAGAVHRTGAVEVSGRGTNRVIDACQAHGVAPPEYCEEAGVVTVTFHVAVGSGGSDGTKSK